MTPCPTLPTSTASPPADDPPADADQIAAAAACLRAGGLVAFPTETVYGLGANACDDAAVARIFAAKGRPRFNPLIVHLAEPAQAADHVPAAVLGVGPGDPATPAGRLMAAFWPGPLTLVLPRRGDCPLSPLVTAGLTTVALRCPAHPVAQALLRETGLPLAAPSANPSGRLSPTTAGHVRDGLGDRVDLILDGGPCGVGLESTVVDLTGDRPAILRPGALTTADLAAVLGQPVIEAEDAPPAAAETGAAPMPASGRQVGDPPAPRSPGMLLRHYAPRARLRLEAADGPRPGEVLLGFGPVAGATANLSPAGDLAEAAAALYALLHALDQTGVAAIAVSPIPRRGLGLALNDRLRRAAAGAGAGNGLAPEGGGAEDRGAPSPRTSPGC